jgi:uncharacterized membrane protein SpoIIM required for sporulation
VVTFGAPFIFGLLAALWTHGFAERILPAETLDALATAYAQGFEQGRASHADARMTGFYVWNNVGIAFRCFATGILFGTGSLLFLTYNGLVTGAVVGHVARQGNLNNILTFMGGHSTYELSAIIICGAAGLKLGYSLIATDGTSRVASLRRCARPALTLVMGSAVLLLIAAVIEGFWSSSSASNATKWLVSGLHFTLLCGFFIFAGRRKYEAES